MESTDIGVLKLLVLYGRYLEEHGGPHAVFLQIIDLFNGTAETVDVALVKYCNDKSISWRRVLRFASDRASVMIGWHFGIAARLKAHNPRIISIQCIALRLALSVAESVDSVHYLKKFKNILTSLCKYYCKGYTQLSTV